jgi:cyclopropane fatty-acyl-phospholipid synthase-like methyltransferase
MQSLEDSVLMALDGTERELLSFLPYILQDLWEIGASPAVMLKLIKKHLPNWSALKILDLGCGKGAVSIQVAQALHCQCDGFDAVPAFIAEARQKAAEYGVAQQCHFEVADIRTKVATLNGYDVIILGAIGPVFGDYHQTLHALTGCLQPDGCILIDDGFIADDSPFEHPNILKRAAMLAQITHAGMTLVDEYTISPEEIQTSDAAIFASIEKRCQELRQQYPAQRHLFENYLAQQQAENDVLETKIICVTMVLKKLF